MLEEIERKPCVVFFDFDNTITSFDVLDDVIKRFSIDEDWITFEKAWEAEKIGSRECLEGQLRSVRLSKNALCEYLSTIKLDPYFKKLLALLKKKGIEALIVSDSFSFFIKEILRNNGIENIPVYANQLRFRGDELIPLFPYESKDCARCAHCKKRHILENKDKMTVYIGDGLSDVCAAQHADWVFAKGSLLEYLRKKGSACVEFKNLGDVHAFLNGSGRKRSEAKKALAIV